MKNRHIKLLVIATLLALTSFQAQAAELKIGNDLTVSQESGSKADSIQSRIDKQAEPYDAVKISDGVSAGVFSGREDYTMKNYHELPTKKKGNEAGVGISLSF